MVDIQTLIVMYLLFIVRYDICCACTMLWCILQTCHLKSLVNEAKKMQEDNYIKARSISLYSNKWLV